MPRKREPSAPYLAMKRYVDTLEIKYRQEADTTYALKSQLEGARAVLRAYEEALQKALQLQKKPKEKPKVKEEAA